ncbi:MAG TPA: hypothetical protein VHD87_08540 [Acidimicrobiales bacterium]|nr:hypothetical protein [Acidimicrobiales bacterium]
MGRRAKALGVLSIVVFVLGTHAPTQAAGPNGLTLGMSGANGTGTAEVPGVACADGGSGDNWHYSYAATAPAGVFTATLPADVRVGLNLHAEPDAVTPTRTYSHAFLLGSESDAWLTNARGALRLAMTAGSGTCADSPLDFDGTTASGEGSWVVAAGTGAYRDASGNGSFDLSAAVGPGADNPFNLNMLGSVAVLQPSISVPGASARWDGSLHLNYLKRVVTVTYTVANTGPGDAFGVNLIAVESLTPGVTAQFAPGSSRRVGDIAAGASRSVSVTYTTTTSNPPCALLVVGCVVQARLTFQVPDALDVSAAPAPSVDTAATAPLLP